MFDFVYLTQLCTNFVLVFKQVRILPEIDWYHYKNANAAPTGIVRPQIKTIFMRPLSVMGGHYWEASFVKGQGVPPPNFVSIFLQIILVNT